MSIECPHCKQTFDIVKTEQQSILDVKMNSRTLNLIIAAITENTRSIPKLIESIENNSFPTECHIIEDYIKNGNVPRKN